MLGLKHKEMHKGNMLEVNLVKLEGNSDLLARNIFYRHDETVDGNKHRSVIRLTSLSLNFCLKA